MVVGYKKKVKDIFDKKKENMAAISNGFLA